MATIAQILAVKWPNAKWSIAEDDYSTLRWESRNIPKPNEAEIRAFSDEIGGELEKGKKAKEREEKIIRKAGDLLDALEIIAVAVGQLAASIDPSVLTKPVDFKDLKALLKRLDDTKDPASGNASNNSGGNGNQNQGGNGGNSGNNSSNNQ